MNRMKSFIQENFNAILALVVSFARFCFKSDPSRSHLPHLQSSTPPSPTVINAESPQSLASPPPMSPSFNLESPPSPSVINAESPPSLPSPPPASPSSNLEPEVLLKLLAAQHDQQWQNAILTFCFSFALGISLQFPKSDKSKKVPSSFVLLSFAVLFTFALHMVAFFISQKHARTSKALEKVALLLAAAALCHAITIPLPLNLKFVAWTLLFLSLFVIAICKFFYGNFLHDSSRRTSSRARSTGSCPGL